LLAGAPPLPCTSLRSCRSVPGRTALDTADEEAHGVQAELLRVLRIPDRNSLALGHLQLAGLVVERPGELVERAVLDLALALLDQRPRFGRDQRAELGQTGEAVLDRAVPEPRLPLAGHGGLHARQVVRTPVVHGCGQPLPGRGRAGVGVVADPGDVVVLGVLAGCRRVHVLTQNTRPRRSQRRRGSPLLRLAVPRERPDHPDLRAGMRRLHAKREGVRMADHLRDGERDDVADGVAAGLHGGTSRHARQVDAVLPCPVVLGLVRLDLLAGGLLEEDLRILVVELPVGTSLEIAVAGGEDHLVAVVHQTRHHLRDLGVLDVLLVRHLHPRTKVLLDVKPPSLVGLRPAAVVVGAGVNPGHLEDAGCVVLRTVRGRAGGSRSDTDGQRRNDDHESADSHRSLPFSGLALAFY
jgi:hypothetical protein